MASCDWQKIKTAGEAKAILRHSTEDTRRTDKHSNKDIDQSRTPLNISIGAMTSYSEACESYDERIAELDAQPGANRRKDRVTMVGLVIPAPDGMDDGTAMQWLSDAYDIVAEEMGDQNMIGGSIQFDERHEYRDAKTGELRMSRAHLHAYAIPEVDGKLNARKVTTRANMVRMNNRLEAMTKERYPGYTWLTGEGRKSRESVEELKRRSDVQAVIAEAQEQAAKIVESARNRADQVEARAADRLWQAEQDRERARSDRQKASDSLVEAQDTLRAAKTTLATVERREKAVTGREQAVKEREQAVKAREGKVSMTSIAQIAEKRRLEAEAKKIAEAQRKAEETANTAAEAVRKAQEERQKTVKVRNQMVKDMERARSNLHKDIITLGQAKDIANSGQAMIDQLRGLEETQKNRGRSL